MPSPDSAPPVSLSGTSPASLARSASLTRPNGATIAYHRLAGTLPGIVFLGGFRSDMTGTKALFLEEYCRERGRAYVRFDYFGHGASSGDFALGTIGRWRDDAVAVIDSLTQGKQILIGSSMSGWIMLLAALARPERIAALIGIAGAPDFTEELLWARLTPAQRREIEERGRVVLPSEYDSAGYLYTRALIEDGRKHLLLGRPIPLDMPVRLLHGMRDESVPWRLSLDLAKRLRSRDVAVTLVKDGDHRLSTQADLARLARTLDALVEAAPA
jgi:pimeloyl-ACP methyl ester carboxylesterase